jgi:hypothetical protein
VAGADQLNYGKLIVYSFPKGQLVFGPEQIYSLINQDTKVAQQITLWDQVGSEVERGKMIIVPVGRVILYIQPIYLKSSTTLKIPELKRVIMTQGQFVVMETNLEEAYAKLVERSKEEMRRIERRFAPIWVEPQPAPQQPEEPQPQVQTPPPTQPRVEPPLKPEPSPQPQPEPKAEPGQEPLPESRPQTPQEAETTEQPAVTGPDRAEEHTPSMPKTDEPSEKAFGDQPPSQPSAEAEPQAMPEWPATPHHESSPKN